MIFISIITIIAAKALPVFTKISSIHNSRIASIIFIYTGVSSFNCFYIQSIGSGIGIYSGLFHITPISQLMEIFLFFIGGCILIGWPQVVQSDTSTNSGCVFKFNGPLYNYNYNYNSKSKNKSQVIKSLDTDKNTDTNIDTEFPPLNTTFESYSTDYSIIVLFSILGSSLLISSFDLISVYLSIELQSFGCAPSEAYVEEVILFFETIIPSGILGPHWGYLPRVNALETANNDSNCIAVYKNRCRTGLPLSDTSFSGGSHGQDNELDTYKVAQLCPNVLSRIPQHLLGILNVFTVSPYCIESQKPYTYFHLEDKNAQDPKTTNPNTYISQPRDLTAYEYNSYLMRGRSFHSSINAKGSSRKSLAQSKHDSNVKDSDSLNQFQGSESPKSVSSWTKNELKKYLNKSGSHNGIINILANPLFLQACYLEIQSKPVNMSKGITNETLEGINLKGFDNISRDIKSGKFNFSPTRRVMKPKPGKNELRPLSVGNPREKIVQKALTVLMEAIWDDKFSENSYGLRPGNSIHQALFQLYRNGSAYQWVIQGDISKCFDKIPHKTIMKCIESYTTCDKTLQLIRKSLVTGYIDPDTGKQIRSCEGIPQVSKLRPLLAKIVLNELDKQIEDIRLSFEKGKKRARNKEYDNLTSRIQYLQKRHPGSPEITELAVKRRNIPSLDPKDPNFRRLMYLRFADDFVVLIAGSIDDANHIKHLIADTLTKKCGLDLHKDKTLINATKEGFKFLGAWCVRTSAFKAGLSRSELGNPAKNRLRMRIEIPIKDLIKKLKTNKFLLLDSNGVPVATARKDLVNLSHNEIVSFFNHRIQGLITFYSFAVNLTSLRKIIMFLQLSCALTLTLKYKLRTKRMAFKKFGRTLEDPETGVKLKLPSELRVKHLYRGTTTNKPDDNREYHELTKSLSLGYTKIV
jgi:group II intron reverse transcriptase/maturase